MAKRPTIVDVARAAGVSAATVSNAMNDRRYVESQTKLRIDLAAARLGYRPNVHARRLRTAGIGAIGLFSSMPFAVSGRLGFLMEIAATAAVSALESGFGLLLVPSMPSGLPRFDQLAIDGAIVLEPSAADPYVAQLQRRGIPLVTIGTQPGAPADAAAIDLRSAETAQMSLDHLRAMGADRIALITGETRRTSYVESEAAYAAFAAAHGMAKVIVRVEESGGEDAAYAATLALMQAQPRVDGILASVDTFAVGTLRALTARGIAVPAMVRLATRYDGQRSRASTPPLTAIDLHLDEVAARAIALLLEAMQSGAPGRAVLAPRPELVVRASTAAALSSAR